MERLIREFTLVDQYARNRLRVEDRCAIMRLTRGCFDMQLAVTSIYADAGRGY